MSTQARSSKHKAAISKDSEPFYRARRVASLIEDESRAQEYQAAIGSTSASSSASSVDVPDTPTGADYSENGCMLYYGSSLIKIVRYSLDVAM